MADLDSYRKKRDFARTPEPAGAASPEVGGARRRFVVHKHAARRLHYDFRLEDDGVLRSWAVPKGPATRPGEKRLAVQVEDHPLEYGEFEGVIPAGEYGAGTVMLWDKGHWQELRRSSGRLDFLLEGTKLRGHWSLVRMRGKAGDGGKNWLLIKRSDAAATSADGDKTMHERSVISGRTMDEIQRGLEAKPARGSSALIGLLHNADGVGRSRMPAAPRPQLATLAAEAPEGGAWIHEIKFDGYRIVARIKDGNATLFSRNGLDWSARFVEIGAELAAISGHNAILDGEVIAVGRDGVSRFALLQEALKKARTAHLIYQVFDLLYLDGFDLKDTALGVRKRILRQLLAATESVHVRYTDHVSVSGREFHAHSCELGLEGIVSKRLDSRYRERRSADWLKVKCARHQEMVIGGFTAPKGTRSAFGALLLGAFRDGALIYAGKVGTGFNEAQLQLLGEMLAGLEQSQSSFKDPPSAAGVRWVQPRLVVDVEYTEWTRDGRLRHPVFRGLREDRNAQEIIMPEPQTGPSERPGAGPRPAVRNGVRLAGVALSHPERVLYPQQGITKLALAEYYAGLSEWILPQVRNRPLSLLRCPQGRRKHCFFQKHPQSLAADVPQVEIEEKAGPAPYLYISKPADLVSLVQAGTLELHVWGSRVGDIERPDILVFDLDPAADVTWSAVLDAALSLRDRLHSLGLESFARTTGGKGLHLVVPLRPRADWDMAKAFARGVAAAHASDDRTRFTVNPSKSRRVGRIFIDYLRNSRGATAIASYSTRARPGAPVAVPVRWDELGPRMTSDRYTIDSVRRRLAALRADPWEDFESARRPLTKALLRRAGARD